MSFIKRIIFYAFLIMGLSISPHLIFAQNVSNHLQETYLNPPEEISEQVTAARFKNVFLSKLGPNRKFFVNYIKKANFTEIGYYAKPFYNLGGLELDLMANRKRTLTNQKDGAGYGENSNLIFVGEEYDNKKKLIAVNLDNTDAVHPIYNYKSKDLYENPGKPLMKRNKNGLKVVMTTADDNADKLVISRESRVEIPDFWLLDLNSEQKTQLTSNIDYNKLITAAIRKRFKVKSQLTNPAPELTSENKQ